MAIYIVALVSFTTFFVRDVVQIVGYDQNEKPFNATCNICRTEYLVEEDGTFAEKIGEGFNPNNP